MTTDVPSPLVPKLRFPEFRITGDWKRDQIGNIASISKGKGVSKADIEKSGFTPCIRYAELYTHYGEVIREALSHTNVPPEDLVLSQAEDVIVPASGETRADIARAACVVPAGVALGGDLNILRSDLSGRFFSYLLNSPLRSKIARLAQGDTVAHLYPGQLSKVTISYPLPAEQQKIADCLGSLDDLIAADGRKLEALRQHKQGLMQQLFPQPGETVPRLRFPEFEEEAAWSARPLTNVVRSISSGLSLTQTNGSNGFRVTRIETIADGTVDINRVGRVMTDQDISSYRLSIGDILVSNINSISQIGKSVLIDRDYDLYHGMNLLRIEALSDVIYSRFLYYWLNTEIVRASIRSRANKAVNQASINQTELGNTVVLLPLLVEQQKIADCLGSLDDLIAADGRKLETLRQHKQGLMQQLFPSLDGQ